MTMSKLSSGKIPASHHSNGRDGKKICKFTPHYMAGNLSLEGCRDCWLNRDASSNYGIDSNGKIACFVEEEHRAWTSSSYENDVVAITVEVANVDTSGRITDKAWQSLVKLATDVCHRYNFKLKFTGTPSGSLTMHKMFAATSCPGAWLEAHMKELEKTVNHNLETGNYDYSGVASGYEGDNSTSEGGGTAYCATPAIAYAAGINAKILPSQEDTHHFVVTVDENSPDLDIEKLKSQDVRWVAIDIGCYFNESHQKRAIFRNKKLKKQVELCKKHKFPFGLYTDIRAWNKKEAEAELYEIDLAVKLYPPSMGIWLSPHFKSKDVKVNDALLDVYYKRLKKIGFFDQMGLYCKKEELEKITWKNHFDNWYWWMDRHLNSVDKLSALPNPKFFMYNNPADEDGLIEPDWEGAANLVWDSAGGEGSLGSGSFGAVVIGSKDKFIQTAKDELAWWQSTGRTNPVANSKKYWGRFTTYNSWCSEFVGYCLMEAGLDRGKHMPKYPVSSRAFYDFYKTHSEYGTVHSNDGSYKPRAGDIAIKRGFSHTEIVISPYPDGGYRGIAGGHSVHSVSRSKNYAGYYITIQWSSSNGNILFLSDIHNKWGKMQSTMNYWKKYNPSVVVVCGDLDEYGRKSGFKEVKRRINKTFPRAQLAVAMGNHDAHWLVKYGSWAGRNKATTTRKWNDFKSVFGSNNTMVETPLANIIVFGDPAHHGYSILPESLLTWIHKCVASTTSSGKLAIVVSHYPFGDYDWRKSTPKSRINRLQNILRSYPNTIYVAGHWHESANNRRFTGKNTYGNYIYMILNSVRNIGASRLMQINSNGQVKVMRHVQGSGITHTWSFKAMSSTKRR